MSARGPNRYFHLGLATVAGLALCLGAASPAGADPAPAAPDVTALAEGLPDPGDHGPNDVTVTEYNDGDTAFDPPTDFPGPIEIRASVHYPAGLDDGPYPLIMLMHGRHSTCYQGSQATGGWPCAAGYQTIPSFQGYDYLAENLASWGYNVVSISANGINARDSSSFDSGMTARGELMQEHLNKWKKFNNNGGAPFGDLFVGKVDLQNVGTMGHSRGGEGVVRNFQINKELGSPYGIKAVLPLAPVDFGRPVINKVAQSVILPVCDGDVSDLQGAHFYDDARYNVANDNSPKYMQEFMKSNHNHFNTIWTPGEFPAGTFNDTRCPSVALTAAEQRDAGEAYMAAFFRMHNGGETAFKPYFDGTDVEPESVEPEDIHTEYHAGANRRLDVNRYLDEESLTTNFLGGDVTAKKVTPFDLCGGPVPQPQYCLPLSGTQQPHNTGARPGLSQLRYGWESKKAKVTNEIPNGDGDVSDYATLTFRIARIFTDERNPDGVAPNFSVVLVDGGGGKRSVKVSEHSDALFAQPEVGSGIPKSVLNTVRIPLSSFRGVDLTDVSKIIFRHNVKKTGAVVTTDLAFSDLS